MVVDPQPLSDVSAALAFLRDRIEERIGAAASESPDDVAAARFFQQSRQSLDAMQRHLDQVGAVNAPEACSYVFRATSSYQDHPDFRSHWRLMG